MSSGLSTPLAQFGQKPPEGIATVPVRFNFGAGLYPQVQTSDFVIGQARGFLTQCRSVFIDNSANSTTFTLAFENGNTIVVPPRWQGMYTVLVPSIQFTVVSTPLLPTAVTVFLINVLMPASAWPAAGNSPLLVTGEFDTQIPLFDPNDTTTGDITDTTIVLAGLAGFGFAMRSAWFTISPGATIAAAGDLTVSLYDTLAGEFARWRIGIPSVAAPVTAPLLMQLRTPAGFLYTAKSLASGIQIRLSTPLTAGSLTYTVNYARTSYVGA